MPAQKNLKGAAFVLRMSKQIQMPNLTTEAPQQYSASKTFTKQHVESIKSQSEIMNTDEHLVEN